MSITDKVLARTDLGVAVAGGLFRKAYCNAAARAILGIPPKARGRKLLAALRANVDLAELLGAGEGLRELRLLPPGGAPAPGAPAADPSSSAESASGATAGNASAADLAAGERRIEAIAFTAGLFRNLSVVALRDVTENAALFDKLTLLASRDTLTGVWNRRRFEELSERDIELARRSASNVGCLMLDLDFFKRVNDEHGHAAGDLLLKAVCKACAEALRSTDILGRVGGEEFAVLLPGTGPEESLMVAERLRAHVEQVTFFFEGVQIAVTVSLGVYSGVPERGQGLSLYLRRADEALYRSKAQGRNRTSYWTPMRAGGGR
jgi:diguanylate cyclase (GGDEF)-like protein